MCEEAEAPEWNEQLSFVELFPPLTRSLRLQLRDDAPLVDVALATHVLDLRQISHPGRAGERLWLPGAAFTWNLPGLVPPLTANPILCLESQVHPTGQIVLLPSETHLSLPEYKAHPRFGPVDRNITTAVYPVTTPDLCSLQIYTYRNKPSPHYAFTPAPN